MAKETTSLNIFGSIYVDPTPQIAFPAVDGISFDYNHGVRVKFPENCVHNYRLIVTDKNGLVLFDNVITTKGLKEPVVVDYCKKYYMPCNIYIYRQGIDEPIWSHYFNIKGQRVLIQINSDVLGDNISWVPYYERFRKKYGCDLYVSIHWHFREILEKQYPEIHWISMEDITRITPYATYYPGLFFEDVDNNYQPTDFRIMGLHKSIANILDVDAEPEERPKFDLSAPRKIKEKYVCIATQASSIAKLWMYPNGWNDVVRHLKSLGYRVLDVDKSGVTNFGWFANYTPSLAEDFTGDIPLQERIDLIKDADFFIGLSSGLSWLAWGCNIPVIMISGFTSPNNEFYTPYRVHSRDGCNSCWNDLRVEYDRANLFSCPIKEKNEEEISSYFECQRNIHPNDVIDMINKVIMDKNNHI